MPGFGYAIRAPKTLPSGSALDQLLRRDDVEFWEKLGSEAGEPWQVTEVRGRRMMVAYLSGQVATAVELFLEGRVDVSVRDCRVVVVRAGGSTIFWAEMVEGTDDHDGTRGRGYYFFVSWWRGLIMMGTM